MAGGGNFKVEFFHPRTMVKMSTVYGWKFWTTFINGIIHLSRIYSDW